jgi:hypothetical protein
MLEIFIAFILLSFLALFILLSFPMKAEDMDYAEKSKAKSKSENT